MITPDLAHHFGQASGHLHCLQTELASLPPGQYWNRHLLTSHDLLRACDRVRLSIALGMGHAPADIDMTVLTFEQPRLNMVTHGDVGVVLTMKVKEIRMAYSGNLPGEVVAKIEVGLQQLEVVARDALAEHKALREKEMETPA